MAVLDSVSKFLRRKRSFDAITLDELRREKIRLEREEAKLAHQVEEVEKQKAQTFLRGKGLPERQKLILANKIKELDEQSANKDRNLRLVSRQLRTVNAFVEMKNNENLLRHSGIWNEINAIAPEALERVVERASVEGAFQLDALERILRTVHDADLFGGKPGEDPDILQIVKAMEDAEFAESDQPDAEEKARMKLDELLKKDREEPGE